MITHSEIQGTNSWLALRRDYFCASEAAAMMGVDPKTSRTALLRMKHTGIGPEFSAWVQENVLEKGHQYEAAFRPILEAYIGQELYPVTGSIDMDGLKLLASFDGLTADDSEGFEHKQINDKFRALRDQEPDEDRRKVPEQYVWQLEQQLLISGALFIYFCASDGTENDFIRIRYESRWERRNQLIAGWKQFAIDLAEYVPAEYIPAPVAKAVTALPAVAVQVIGSIDVRDNFKVFQTALTDFIDNRLIRDPKTDQDFADLDQQIKALKDAEDAIKGAETNMLSQVESVDAAKKMMDTLHKLARDNRLMAEKLLAAKKESVKADIVNQGRKELLDHVEALNKRLGKPYMPAAVADFQGAIKGKRNIDSLREAVNVTLANAKIAASAQADKIEINLKSLRELAGAYAFLFADTAQLVMKENDDLVLLINARITQQQAASAARLEADRERIRAEETKKLADAAAADAKRLADAEAAEQPQPEAPAASIPVQAEQKAEQSASVLQKPTPSTFASTAPTLSATGHAFIASRIWPNDAIRNSARAVLIEYERFCAQQMKVAA